ATAVAVIASALVLGLVSPAAQADALVTQPGELVVNGDAEQPTTAGWTGSLHRATHGTGGYPGSVIVNSSGLTGETYPGGSGLFAGVGAVSTATQTISLSTSAAAIDNGQVDALLSVYIGGYANQRDHAQVTYTFYDADGTELAAVEFGPATSTDRGNISGFIHFSETVRLPAGAREAVITIDAVRYTAPANDGYVDNVSLMLDAPSPTAIADTASTPEGVPVIINAPGNDEPGTGAEIVPGSLRLLDGDIEVTRLTTPEGLYVVDTETGDVEFTPAPGYFGTTPPLPYRITDSSGQRADSTITVEVVFTALPSLTMVKSATPADPADYVFGTIITYSFVVTNTGNVPINGITISEGAFTGSGSLSSPACPSPSLEPGAQMTCAASYTLTQTDVDNEGVSNTANASGTAEGFDIPIESDPSTFDIPVTASPAISLLKSADALAATAAGDAVDYSFLVTNTGNVTVDTVSITEDSFSGTGELSAVTCPVTNLLPGAFTACAASYTLTQADVDAGTIHNTAIANALYGNDPVISEASSASTTIDPRPAFDFTKTATATAVTTQGQEIDYTFTILNTGNITLTNVTINDTDFSGAGELSAINCPSTSVAPGGTLNCSATYIVVAADLREKVLSNSATAEVAARGEILISNISTVDIPVDVPETEEPLPGGGDDPTDGGTYPDPEAGNNQGPDTDNQHLAQTGGDASYTAITAGFLILAAGGVLFAVARKRGRQKQAFMV
ncbi:DUF7507 domain-containing protein, partial [Leucobacter manosquensis]